ncbi:hypothetical protein K438DRAFT_1773383 [Mycena galopus ATCC 62051]|nr:hypothetical protein K438DRAFT_1773383 [Mycena galopus ATCC 62051]
MHITTVLRVPPGFTQRNARVPAPIPAEDRALNRDVTISSAQTSAEYLRADLNETESQPCVIFGSTQGTLDLTGWNCWPDGKFERLFDWQQTSNTHGLATNWVVETLGHEIRHRYLGAITCHGRSCGMSLEPSLRAIDRHRRIEHECWGFHNHPKFTHSSISQPDGSLVFVEHNAKYTTSELDNEPRTNKTLNKLPPSPDASEFRETNDQEEWLGIGSEHDRLGITSMSKVSGNESSVKESTEKSVNSEDSLGAEQPATSETNWENAESEDFEFHSGICPTLTNWRTSVNFLFIVSRHSGSTEFFNPLRAVQADIGMRLVYLSCVVFNLRGCTRQLVPNIRVQIKYHFLRMSGG